MRTRNPTVGEGEVRQITGPVHGGTGYRYWVPVRGKLERTCLNNASRGRTGHGLSELCTCMHTYMCTRKHKP